MNNRFKFRVWLPDENRFMDNRFDNPIIDGNGNLMWSYLTPFAHWEHRPMENAIIEQCTGLTDKNGKLIYEGDVFEATVLNSFDGDHLIEKRIRGQVSFFTDAASFAFAAYSPCNLGELEIIGNIHDNQFRDLTKKVEGQE